MKTSGRAQMATRLCLSSRVNPGTALTRVQAARAAIAAAEIVRKISDGRKPGLKKPAQTLRVSSQVPGVSCQDRMPLIQNRLIQEANE